MSNYGTAIDKKWQKKWEETELYKFNPNKLKVIYRQEINKKLLETPRKYTLTHSDKTANLFLTIGKTYDYKSINYNMRDEVFASWEKDDKYYLKVKLEVDNGESLVKVILRNKIFREELPLALKAIVYGDRLMIENNKFLYYSHVIVYFKSKIEKYNSIEEWGVLGDYKYNG